jgi:hypothetical protein
MNTAQTSLIVIVSSLVCVPIGGCGRTTPPSNEAAETTRASGSSGCVALDNYTVLEVGTSATTDPKKVADGCWWQFRVPRLHGYVQQPLGWQLCNFCDVDIEFELRSVPAFALTGCSTFFDAANTAHETVRAGETRFVGCIGLQPVREMYDAGARVAKTQGPFIADDPEIEIEDRTFMGRTSRLAQTSGVTQCVSAATAPESRRLTVSGTFARQFAESTVVLVPTGPGFLDAVWGGDLVEIAPRQGRLLGEPERAGKFSISVDLPAYVTQFVLRDASERKEARLVVQEIPQCQ